MRQLKCTVQPVNVSNTMLDSEAEGDRSPMLDFSLVDAMILHPGRFTSGALARDIRAFEAFCNDVSRQP